MRWGVSFFSLRGVWTNLSCGPGTWWLASASWKKHQESTPVGQNSWRGLSSVEKSFLHRIHTIAATYGPVVIYGQFPDGILCQLTSPPPQGDPSFTAICHNVPKCWAQSFADMIYALLLVDLNVSLHRAWSLLVQQRSWHHRQTGESCSAVYVSAQTVAKEPGLPLPPSFQKNLQKWNVWEPVLQEK